MAPRAVGGSEPQRQPGYPVEVYRADRVEVRDQWKGTIAALRGLRPANGTAMAGFAGVYVEEAIITPGNGDTATLDILATNEETVATDDAPVFEVRWVREVIDLKLHPIYRTGGTKALTATDKAAIALWEQEQDYALKAAYKITKPTGGIYELSDNAKHLAAKLLDGRTNFPVRIPVARKVSYHRTVPTTNPCDKRITGKPFTACPEGYIWVSSEDQVVRRGKSGKWERSREWEGFLSVDTDLYPTS